MRWKIAQWFERQWWIRYLSDKNEGSYLEWKVAYWKDFLGKIGMFDLTGKEVLDAGCGPAGIFIALKEARTTATDPLLRHYEKALRPFNMSDHPGVRFLESKIEDLAHSPAYDVVFCLNAINHVEDIDKAYHVLVSVLKPGGTLVMSIDSHNYLFPKWLFRTLHLDILHPHQYSIREYASALLHRGLRCDREIILKRGLIFNYYALIGEKV